MKGPILLAVVLLSVVSGCENEAIDYQSLDSCQDYFEWEIQESCTYLSDRKTVDRLKNAKGFYETVYLSSNWTAVTIRPERSSAIQSTLVYVPCNLPSYNFYEGQELIFSGNLKERITPGNDIGPPLELTSLKIRCRDVLIPGTNTIGPPFEFTQIKVNK